MNLYVPGRSLSAFVFPSASVVRSVRTSLLFTSTILNTAPFRGFLSPNSSTFNNSTSPVFKLFVAVTVAKDCWLLSIVNSIGFAFNT